MGDAPGTDAAADRAVLKVKFLRHDTSSRACVRVIEGRDVTELFQKFINTSEAMASLDFLFRNEQGL